jgi:hypothetical protein
MSQEPESQQDRGKREAKEANQRNIRGNFAYSLQHIGRIARDAHNNDNMWARYVRAYDELLKLAGTVAEFGDRVQIPARLEYKGAVAMVDVAAPPPAPTVVNVRSNSLPGSAIVDNSWMATNLPVKA